VILAGQEPVNEAGPECPPDAAAKRRGRIALPRAKGYVLPMTAPNKPAPAYPATRMRRNRKADWSRRLVAENSLPNVW
jgi:hypothetical protein